MAKYIIAAIAIIFVGLVGYSFMKQGSSAEMQQQPVEPAPFVAATSTYASSTMGFVTVYPKEYSVMEDYAYDQFGQKKLIHGIKFLIPETMATGTNLSAFDSGVSVEALPRAQRCTADIYIKDNVKASSETINGVAFSVASTSGAGAGNLYEEIVYAFSDSKPCTALRYFIHSTSISNFTPGTVREFDRSKLLADFDSIRDMLRLTR